MIIEPSQAIENLNCEQIDHVISVYVHQCKEMCRHHNKGFVDIKCIHLSLISDFLVCHSVNTAWYFLF